MVVAKGNSRIMVTLSDELRESLEKEAKKENRSLSNYIVTVLKSTVQDNHLKK